MVAKDARSSLENLLNEMRPLLLVAGVPTHQIRMRSGRHKIATCVKAFDWLHDIYLSEEYRQIKYVWSLLPPEVWKRYETVSLEDTREQILLSNAQVALLKLWKNKRPRLFGKNRVSDLQFIDTSNMDSCRP